MEDLRHKIVLVTGAARGMGRFDAENFCREGSVVVMTDVDEAELDKGAEELKAKGYEVYPYKLDVSDRDACFALAEKVKADVGVVDVLINNAGVTECHPVLDLSEQSVRRMMEVNYMGQVWMLQAFVPDMVKRGSGHVVDMCSVAGKVGVSKMGGYCATKAAMLALTDAIRIELRKSGVNFTIVNPSFVSTGMFEGGARSIISPWQTPEQVAEKIVNAVKKNKAEVCAPSGPVRLAAFLRGLCIPKFSDFALHLFGLDRPMENWQKDSCRPF